MSQKLKGKTVLITGSSDGLGKLLALELSKSGLNVIVHGRDEAKVNSVLSEIQEMGPKGEHDSVICDFNNPESVSESFSKIDKLEILINNAGLWTEGDTVETTPDRIIELVNVNLTSYLLVSRVMLPVLQSSEFSQILNVSSIAGVEIPFDYYHTIYSATKYGVQAFSEALSKEFENKNIRVMGFYPGGMDTQFFTKAGLDYGGGEPWMFDPIEAVEAIIFMLSRNKKVNVKRLDLVNHLEV